MAIQEITMTEEMWEKIIKAASIEEEPVMVENIYKNESERRPYKEKEEGNWDKWANNLPDRFLKGGKE